MWRDGVCRHDNLTQIASWILLPPMLSLFSTNDAWGEERRETVNRIEGGGETETEKGKGKREMNSRRGRE